MFISTTLPAGVDSRSLRHLSRLQLNCRDKINFHQVVVLLSSVFGQRTYLSLKLQVYLTLPDLLIISGDTIQRLCIDRLDSLATFALYLRFTIFYDSNDKMIFNSFFQVSFTNQQQPKVVIRDNFNTDFARNTDCFVVYTLSYNVTTYEMSLFPKHLQTSCCRLPFTDGECQVNRKGPHRYQIMPDRQSGRVTESTECYINDFDANYRKVVETKNYCNDCPGLLIFHANSSDIFLFPEYLERILEGRTRIQRKNVVILTTSLVGAYDLDFTLLSRYYASRPVNEVPSLYVDLQLPAFDPKQQTQASLRLRLPTYADDKEGLFKISRYELISPLQINEQSTENFHQLPDLYHFDIEKLRHQPDLCSLYDVDVSSSSLIWKKLDSGASTCHTFMPYLGRNKCFATGFTRLFCSIEEDISNEDRLQLSPYLKTTNHVEHLTIAVTGGRHVMMSLRNEQTRPAEQVKILLLQGHLSVTDINLDLPLRVEYGRNCEDFSLAVSAGFSATRYRRFDGESSVIIEGNSLIPLPSCFRVIPSSAPVVSSVLSSTVHPPAVKWESDKAQIIITNQTRPEIIIKLNITNGTKEEMIIDLNITNPIIENDPNVISNFSDLFLNENNLVYTIIVLLVLVALIPLALALLYHFYFNGNRKSGWTLDHNNPKDTQTDASIPSYVNHSTQTTDTPIRI